MTWTDDQIQNILASKLFPYQTAWIGDRSKYAIWQKSRRIGASWCEAIAATLYSLSTGEDTWFSSSDEKNAKEWILYVKQFCQVINAILGLNYIDLEKATTECVTLPNGTRLTCLSSNPTQFRGKQGRIVIDEFALHEDQRELYRAAQGCITQRGVLRLISTHNGPTLFYEFVVGAPENGFAVHTTTLVDAVNQGYAIKFAKHLHQHLPDVETLNRIYLDEVRKGCVSEDAYRQEFMCAPISLQSLVDPEDYDKLAIWEVPEALDVEHQYHPLHIGIDVGRTHDLTVAWVIEEFENPKATGAYDRYDYKTVAKLEIRNTDIPTQFQQIAPLLAHASVSTIAIDQGTVGRALADLVLDAYPFTTMFTFTNPAKARLAERVRGFVQSQRISLPPDAATKADITSMRRQVSKGGNVVYDGNTGDSHCDRFWALSLSLEAATTGMGAELVTAA